MKSVREGRIDVKQAAEYLGIDIQSIRAAARNGRIGYMKIGRQYFFTLDDLNQIVKINTPHATNTDII